MIKFSGGFEVQRLPDNIEGEDEIRKEKRIIDSWAQRPSEG
jgi:hypothetical protein